MKKLIKTLKKFFTINPIYLSGDDGKETFRKRLKYGTHYSIGKGRRCYCIKKLTWTNNWITIYETDSEEEWIEMYNYYSLILFKY